MTAIHFMMMTLATWRLTELVTQDRISDFIRRRHKVHYFWTCVRCVSVWAGAISVLTWYFVPFLNWPLGLSMTFLLYSSFSAHWNYRGQPRITVFPDAHQIDWGSYDPEAGKKIMAEAFAMDKAQLVRQNGGR